MLPLRSGGWVAQAVGIAGDVAIDQLKNALCCRESIYDEHTTGSMNPFHSDGAQGDVWLPGLDKAHGGLSGVRLDWAW